MMWRCAVGRAMAADALGHNIHMAVEVTAYKSIASSFSISITASVRDEGRVSVKWRDGV